MNNPDYNIQAQVPEAPVVYPIISTEIQNDGLYEIQSRINKGNNIEAQTGDLEQDLTYMFKPRVRGKTL